MAAPFSAMEPNSVKIYHTNTTGRTTPSKSNPTPSPNAGRFSTATFKTKSVSAATQTTTTMPALCPDSRAGCRAGPLSPAGGGRAAAQPIQRHAAAQASTSQPSHPNAAVKAPHNAATAAFAYKKPFFLSKFPFIFKHSIHFCTNQRATSPRLTHTAYTASASPRLTGPMEIRCSFFAASAFSSFSSPESACPGASPYTPTALGQPAYWLGSRPLPAAVARASKWQWS